MLALSPITLPNQKSQENPGRTKKQRRSQAAKVSRRLALLHAHGLIAKVPKTYRWQVTESGRRILTALLAARQADTDQLIALAA